MDSSDDYYKVLGVPKDASEPDISRAYRELIKKWHSDEDLSTGETAENDLRLIAEAYEVLSDPIKRETYDQHGKKGLAASQAAVARPAGESESESGDENGDNDEWNCDDERDDLDELNDMLERFSYGSNYDEDIDELLNDSNYDEAYGDEGDASSLREEVGGDQPGDSNGCGSLSVTEGW